LTEFLVWEGLSTIIRMAPMVLEVEVEVEEAEAVLPGFQTEKSRPPQPL